MNKNDIQNEENTFQKAEDILVEVEKEGKEGIKAVENAAHKVSEVTPVKQVKQFWHNLGPGLTTGAADDDPSGVGTYSQTGAKYGFQLLWLAVFTFPLMAIIQEMCARIGLVTGRGLAANIKKYFPQWVLYTVAILVLMANSFNIGANLGAMAKSTQLLAPYLPFWFLIIAFVLISLFLQIFISYQKYARYLKYLALILLVYVATAFFIKDFAWKEVLISGIVPSLNFSKDQIILICGILGTTISPYLFFWETSQEVEEKISEGKTTIAERQEIDKKEIRKMRTDVWVGMFLSNLVMFFIIAVTATTLFRNGIIDITSAADAAAALEPLAGRYASLLFSIGIIGTGLLAIPILAGSASYAVSETLGWKEGLYLRFRQGIYFYGVIIFSMLIGLLLNFVGINPIKALIYAAVANGLVAPVILILIVIIANNRKIMNSHHNSPFIKFLGWVVVALMVVAGIATIISFF
ncbi:MAG: Natural resistance-associated macrophage protein [Berkelbacteria bacterium GW2011_GWB1_38_5]|uniref:Natural resistance-associated macrophage protein n=2 Tax=Candidatus Berkelbacteria TaxID=1618330 RepID=A0A0G0FKL5_9BACT|nr:MAG: Natural resistance-associated macrophage protein [Berkelbacteria bacterium GW2011_GWA1_36_9]KKQ73726.1 MAG: Natural resistance-associated macrophage protein [Berkelbacteria bacterium GW2011_GWB1_38_5]